RADLEPVGAEPQAAEQAQPEVLAEGNLTLHLRGDEPLDRRAQERPSGPLADADGEDDRDGDPEEHRENAATEHRAHVLRRSWLDDPVAHPPSLAPAPRSHDGRRQRLHASNAPRTGVVRDVGCGESRYAPAAARRA